ncbi:MAG: hypothetical protein EP330_19785 [Deltaproteobacteria bacterium]|nr:MAG: hypothetical protein EP330_19785 [Deltaproteobacteria bacterium]
MRVTMLAVLLVMGCSKSLEPVEDETTDDVEADTDTDTDVDSDADSDSDSDSDADTDTDTDPNALDCSAFYPTDAPGWQGTTCMTGMISCNQTIDATNDGGSYFFSGTEYDQMFCRGEDDWTDTFNGPERVYELYVPANTVADVNLETPCNTLALRVLSTGDRCASREALTCDAYDSVTPYEQEVTTLLGGTQGRTFQIIVDGINDQIANFRLSVDCVSR